MKLKKGIYSATTTAVWLFLLLFSITAKAQTKYLAVGERGTYVCVPEPEYPYTGYGYCGWDNMEAPNMGFTHNPIGDVCTEVGVASYFSGTQYIRCTYTWTRVSDRGGTVASPVMYKTFAFRCSSAPTPVTFNVAPTSVELTPGENSNILAWFTGDVPSSITWSSSNESVAKVTNNLSTPLSQTITAVAPGTCQITISGGGGSASCSVTVRYKTPESISLPDEKTIKIGQTITLTPTFTPSGAGSDLVWTSSNPDIATVNSSGRITGKAEGVTLISATTTNGLSAICRIEVYKPVPSSIQLSEQSMTIPVGDTRKLTYTVAPSDAIYTVDWQSDASDIASVDNSGMVTAHKEGTACISVITDNGVSARCVVNVPPLPEQVYLPDTLYISPRKEYLLNYRLSPSDAQANGYSWQSSDEKVATVTDKGLVKALDVGQTEVTLQTSNGLRATCVVVVLEPLYNLVVWTKDGSRTDFSFGDQPQVTISDDVFSVTSQRTTVEYNALDIEKFTVECLNENTGQLVDAVSSPVQPEMPTFNLSSDVLTLSGCRPQSAVDVFSMDARRMAHVRTDNNGCAQLSLAGWSRGVYIVKTETTTFKISRK